MNGRKDILIAFGFAISVGLIASAVAVLFITSYYSRMQFELIDAICGEIAEQEPEARKIVSAALKEYTRRNGEGAAKRHVLWDLGYRISDFSAPAYGQIVRYMAAGFLAGIALFLSTFLYRNRREALRIQALAAYLEQVDAGRAAILSSSGEDDFSKLEDEIYKTVTFLRQTKEAAMQAKNEFAENLSNIAHQLKTPITAISLSIQMAERNPCRNHLEQVQKQLSRLTHLEEALLLLSRIDAGALSLEEKEVDVFTLLVLAADNLQELLAASGTSVEIPEQGGMMVMADLDWTMEAVMNLMKNCMEHGKGKGIHCSYTQNPLYTEILIWDEGDGFAKEDIPHLFERFYRGQNPGRDGIGIGLALSKEIIQRQNGTLRARNRSGGGALFEIRFYSH